MKLFVYYRKRGVNPADHPLPQRGLVRIHNYTYTAQLQTGYACYIEFNRPLTAYEIEMAGLDTQMVMNGKEQNA